MITFLKLGGSLITDKRKTHTARPDVIKELAEEIFTAWEPERGPLLIGHGSGSFGHIPAKKYGTRNGVRTEAEWAGFAEVHAEATALNRIVTDILRECGLPVLTLVPMDSIRTEDGKVKCWDTGIIGQCFGQHLIPLIFGDTVFDSVRGGTILSTEDLFLHLCHVFREPPRILLAGLEEGVWEDYPENTKLIRTVHACSPERDPWLQSSEFTDVTGGMREKVHLMETLIREEKASSAVIFTGTQRGNVLKAYQGLPVGTEIIR